MSLEKHFHSKKSLRTNENGAIFIIGIFAAMILCGCLFYAMGTVEAIQHREILQDAADGAAYSAGSMQARAMNLVSLLNIVKFSTLSVLSTLAALHLGMAEAVKPIQLLASIIAPEGAIVETDIEEYNRETTAIIQSADLTQQALQDVLVSAEISIQGLVQNSKVFTEHPAKNLPIKDVLQRGTLCQGAIMPGPLFMPNMVEHIEPLYDDLLVNPNSPIANIDQPIKDRMVPLSSATTSLMCMKSFRENNPNFKEIDWTTVTPNDFATRFYSSRDTVPNEAESGMRIVLKDPPEANPWITRIRDFAGSAAWAQSYFYVTDDLPKETSLWRLDWQASLGKFSLPNRQGIVTGCNNANAHRCAAISNMIVDLQGATSH